MKWARLFQSANLISTRLFGLDAVQGSKEERARRMEEYGERVTDAADAAMRQENWRNFGFAESRPARPKSSGGYTIIEVLIVLAISGAILSSSVAVFSGRKGATEFSQAMYDLQSKFQNYANSASSAALPSGEAYICQVSGLLPDGKVYPVLSPPPAGSSDTTNQDCIYLGRAIQIIPGSDTIYNYPVFGLRTVHNGSLDSGDFPASVVAANPEPALDAGGNFLLVESYPLLNGLSVVSATTDSSPGEQDLLTLYSSLQNNNTSGNQITASARSYTFGSNDAKSTRLRSCIEGSSCGTDTEVPLIGKSWNLCVQNAAGNKKASLSIRGTATGITTKLNLEGCS